MLIVIAIIGLLAAIVLVSLSKAREKAKIAAGLEFGQSVYHFLGSDAVGVWDFNEGSGNTTADGSGYGNDGVLGNGTCTPGTGTCPDWATDTASGQGYALEFDGIDDYVFIGRGGSLDNIEKRTLAVWINPNPPGGTLFYKGEWSLQLSTDKIVYTHGAGYWMVDKSLSFGNWHHVTVSYDASSDENNPEVYINGLKQTVILILPPSAGAFDDSDDDLIIGNNRIGAGGMPFNGKIDEARVYEGLLSEAEIQKLYVEGLKRHKVVGK